MPNPNIEFSKEGIKISYLRLLSDSTAGFLIILFGILIYYFPIYGYSLQESHRPMISTEGKILLIVLLALISSPLGLAINTLSWICLGQVQVWLQKCLFNKTFLDLLAKGSKEEFQFEKYKKYFHLTNKDDWYQRAQLIKQSISVYYPQIPDAFEHVRGVRTLFRNISFLLLLFSISMIPRAYFINNSLYSSSVIFIVGLFLAASFMAATAIVGFYYNSQIYMKVYILCLEAGKDNNFQAKDNEIIEVLSGSIKIGRRKMKSGKLARMVW